MTRYFFYVSLFHVLVQRFQDFEHHDLPSLSVSDLDGFPEKAGAQHFAVYQIARAEYPVRKL